MAVIIDGKEVAREKREQIKNDYGMYFANNKRQ